MKGLAYLDRSRETSLIFDKWEGEGYAIDLTLSERAGTTITKDLLSNGRSGEGGDRGDECLSRHSRRLGDEGPIGDECLHRRSRK